jgi:hypothetical protein
MKRFSAAVTEEAIEAMLMMLPRLAAIIAGRNALMQRYMARTLRVVEKSKSSSEQSRMVPWWTKPAQLNSTSRAPRSRASAAIAAGSVTSRIRISMPASLARDSSGPASISVAMTWAPSAAKASAAARPMP